MVNFNHLDTKAIENKKPRKLKEIQIQMGADLAQVPKIRHPDLENALNEN
jgi:hypothetical protein